MSASIFLTNPTTHPVGLHVLCIKSLGSAYVGWEPETIWEELKRLYGKEPSALNKAKINACRAVHTADQVFEDWHLFEKVVMAFGFIMPQFGVLQKPSPTVLAHGVWVMSTLRGKILGPDIEKFSAGVLIDAGFAYPPKELKFTASRMKQLVPRSLYNGVRALLSGADKALPQNAELAAQILRHRDLRRYVNEYKRLHDEHIAEATRLAV